MIKPKEFTAFRVVLDVMDLCYKTGQPMRLTGLKNPKGQEIKREQFSMMINKLSKENFEPGIFYTQTDKKDGNLYLGCYKPLGSRAQ